MGWLEGSVRGKDSKDKRVCVMCHDGDRSSAFGFCRGDRGQTNGQKKGERDGERGARVDQKDCSYNDETSDWTDTVSIQFALISVSASLTDAVLLAGDG